MSQSIVALLVFIGTGASSAFVHSANRQASHQSESSYSSSSSNSGSRTYSYSSQSARGPGYSYSFSHSNGGTPFVSSYASGFHSYTPTFVPSLIDLDLDLDLDIDPDLDFYIDTDLDVDDLDLDLDFPFIGYGIGYIGRYGHWIRKPKYGFSRLYHDIDLDSLNYGGHYGYSHLDTLEPSGFNSLLSFFK